MIDQDEFFLLIIQQVIAGNRAQHHALIVNNRIGTKSGFRHLFVYIINIGMVVKADDFTLHNQLHTW